MGSFVYPWVVKLNSQTLDVAVFNTWYCGVAVLVVLFAGGEDSLGVSTHPTRPAANHYLCSQPAPGFVCNEIDLSGWPGEASYEVLYLLYTVYYRVATLFARARVCLCVWGGGLFHLV